MNSLITLIGTSMTRPGEAAGELLAMGIPREGAWMMLGASIILTVLVSFVLSGGEAMQLVPGLEPLSPVLTVLFLGCLAVIMSYGIYFTGNAMDGGGTLTGSLLVVAWLQVLQFTGLLAQAVVYIISPEFSAVLGFGIALLLFWVLLCFIDVLHGFGSLGRAALLMLFVIVGIMLGLTLILGLIGVGL